MHELERNPDLDPDERSRHCALTFEGGTAWVRLPCRAATRAPAVLDAMEASGAMAVVEARVRLPSHRAWAFARSVDEIVERTPLLKEPIADGEYGGLAISCGARAYRIEPIATDAAIGHALAAIGARAQSLGQGAWRVLHRRGDALRTLVHRLERPRRRTTRVLHVEGVEITRVPGALLVRSAQLVADVPPIALHPAERQGEPGLWRLALEDVGLYNRWALSASETPPTEQRPTAETLRSETGRECEGVRRSGEEERLRRFTVRRTGERWVLEMPRDHEVIDALRALGGTYLGGRRWSVRVRTLRARRTLLRALLARLDEIAARRLLRRARRTRTVRGGR